MKMSFAGLGTAILLSSFPLFAGDPCENAMTQAQMTACTTRKYQQADKALNRTYKRVMGRLDVAGQKSLRAKQRGWIKDRDRKCQAEAREVEGGTMYRMMLEACMAGLTEKRTDELSKMLR